MFAKDKIKLDLRVEKLDIYPGENISGTLTVDVSDEVECTAVRVQVSGTSTTTVKVSEGTGKNRRTVTYTESHDFFNQVFTCYGFSKSSGRKGGCFLTPGATYSYNFSSLIPPGVPGTVTCNQGSARVNIIWSIRGYVDIHHGFDKEVITNVFVRTPAATAQVWSKGTQKPRLDQDVASCGCTGCYCCATGEHVSVTPSVSPSVVMVDCATYTNNQPAGAFRVDVEVVNGSAKVMLKDARIIVSQRLMARARGRTVTTEVRLAEVVLPCPTTSADVGHEEFVVYSGNIALGAGAASPSIASDLFVITHLLQVDFPHSKVKEGIFENGIVIANGEDASNQCVPLPRFYPCGDTVIETQL